MEHSENQYPYHVLRSTENPKHVANARGRTANLGTTGIAAIPKLLTITRPHAETSEGLVKSLSRVEQRNIAQASLYCKLSIVILKNTQEFPRFRLINKTDRNEFSLENFASQDFCQLTNLPPSTCGFSGLLYWTFEISSSDRLWVLL